MNYINHDDDDDETASVWGLADHKTNNGQADDNDDDDDIQSICGLTHCQTPDGQHNPFINVIMKNDDSMVGLFEVVLENLKATIKIKPIIQQNHVYKKSLANRFEEKGGFKKTLQRWMNRANVRTDHMLIILYLSFNSEIFTDTSSNSTKKTRRDYNEWKKILKSKDPDLSFFPWNDNLWNLMTSVNGGISLFSIMPQNTTWEHYTKAFDFISSGFINFPQISAQLWDKFWQKANNNNWTNTGTIFKELANNFKEEICRNPNHCNYYHSGKYLYIYIFIHVHTTR